MFPSRLPCFVLPSLSFLSQVNYFVLFREQSNKQSLIVVGSGYGLEYYRHDLFVDLARQYNELQFVLFIYGTRSPSVSRYLRESQESLSNFRVVLDQDENTFSSFLAGSDIYIRTSSIDSRGLAVSDAIQLNTFAIASDVCERHPECLLFQSGNYSSLAAQFEHLIDSIRELKLSSSVARFKQCDGPPLNIEKQWLHFINSIISSG